MPVAERWANLYKDNKSNANGHAARCKKGRGGGRGSGGIPPRMHQEGGLASVSQCGGYSMMGSMALDLEQSTVRCQVISPVATAIVISVDPLGGGSRVDVAHDIGRGTHRADAPPRA